MKLKLLFCGAVLAVSGVASAQTLDDLNVNEQYNPNSLNPIPLYEQHYKVRVWRAIDLQEKQNKGFFAKNGEISKFIVDAIMSGEIADIYETDSLVTKLSKDKFIQRQQQEDAVAYEAWNPTTDYYTDDIRTYNGKNYRALADSKGANPESSPNEWTETSEGKAANYYPADMTMLNIMEDIIFDKRRSRLYYDIQAFELAIPGSKTKTGFNTSLCWIRYKDLEKVFRAHPEKAIWFNRYNTAQNKNFADAFLLRLFKGALTKVENPDDETIAQIFINNGRPYREAVMAMEWNEMMLMEKEHNLWEF
jgi:gliding motility associated protien GldN